MKKSRFHVGDHVIATGTNGAQCSGFIMHPFFEDSEYVTIKMDSGDRKGWCANCYQSTLKHLKTKNPLSIQLELNF